MGDIFVNVFLETLKNLTTSSLDFIIDKKHQLQYLAEEIDYLRGFLKITEKKRNEHQELLDVVWRIKDVISEAEDVVELFVVLASKASTHTSDSLLERQDRPSLDLESIKEQIKTLRAEVKHILDENIYDINGAAARNLQPSSTESRGASDGLRSSGRRNTSVVGFEDEIRRLLEKLHAGEEGGHLEIISIVGAGGAGKTTLAREVYDHPLTSEKFEICAWVEISQEYNKTRKSDLLIRILKQVSSKIDENKMSEDELGEEVYKCLRGRRYLIVMDDVWDIKAWNDIQRSFSKESKGSKVLLTSRLPVQLDGVHHVPHFLGALPKSCGWELLKLKVFGKKQCPQELVDIGMRIAEKCDGLPLAIVTIAGILAGEDKTLDVWKEVAKHIGSIIAKNQKGCMGILELSYNYLPLHLKACFLYFGAYKEDCEIPTQELIWSWIAEGFIELNDSEGSLEDVAEAYLNSLIDRGLIIVARKSKSHEGIKGCRIHDLLRELCLKKAEEDNFLVHIYKDDSSSPSTTNKHRRVCVDNKFIHNFSSRLCARNLRSVLGLSLDFHLPRNEPGVSFSVENFKLLRVLKFIPTFGREIWIKDQVHLRYLALMLPSILYPVDCPHYPSNLEILIVDEDRYINYSFPLHINKDYGKITLPRDILKMVKLRHVYSKTGIFHSHDDSCDEDKGNMLDSLQTLSRICSCLYCLQILERTPNLKKLGLATSKERNDNMRRLMVPGFSKKKLMVPDLEHLKCLDVLKVQGRCAGLKLPTTLTRLTLHGTQMEWELLSEILKTLESLEVLKLLRDACEGRVWNTSELDDFSRLKYLRLERLDFEEWIVSENQFPKLEVLVINMCLNLKKIPIEFAGLYELREIRLVFPRPTLLESAKMILEEQKEVKGDDDCPKLIITSHRDFQNAVLSRERLLKTIVTYTALG